MKDKKVRIKSVSGLSEKDLSEGGAADQRLGRNKRFCLIIVIVVVVSFVMGGVGSILFDKFLLGYLTKISFLAENDFFKFEKSKVVIQKEERVVSREEPVLKGLISRVNVSVVGIIKEDEVPNPEEISIVRKMEGYGLIITADGLIVTSSNVFTDAKSKYKVIVSSGNVYEIEKIINDPASEAAFVSVEADGLSVVELGISDDVAVGQKIFSLVRDPFGNIEVRSGVVESKNYNLTFPQSVEKIEGYFRSGISNLDLGNPLFDFSGRVIGVNVAKEGNDLLALPSDEVGLIIDDIIKERRIIRSRLGMKYVKIDSGIAAVNDLLMDRGLLVFSPDNINKPAVIASGSAFEAGIRFGDIITKIGDREVEEDFILHRALKKFKIGDEIEMTYLRDGKETKTKLILKEVKNRLDD
jgi:S1-C subfamily serine protease